VPYKIFGLFLVHKISIYKHICENGKKKRKRIFLAKWRGGAATWPSSARQREQRGSTCQRGGTALGGDGGSAERKPTAGARRWFSAGARRRFSASDPAPGGWGGGEARVGIGGHGGGVNLVGGGLERSVRGDVAGARGGEVAGEAYRCNR
jgi:hypothetical protein